jgi:hypothetical protein
MFFFYIILNLFLGGTLGLFTGMSLLSVFEVAFWLVRFFTLPFRRSVDQK